MIAREQKRELIDQSDAMLFEEVPKSASLSGWMRNDREANEFNQQQKRTGSFS
jgi:hypothetical protein